MGNWKQRNHKIVIPQQNKLDKIKCLVCGNEFIPTKEGHYVCRDDITQGGIGNAMSGNKEPSLWDCWDCPVCGTQLRGKQRFREYDSRVDEIMDVKAWD